MANQTQSSGGVAGSGTSSNSMIPFKVTLTAAQVKNAFSSNVSLIAAPGANKIIYIDPNSVCVKLSAGTAFNFAIGFCLIGGGGLAINIPVANINDDTFLTTQAGFIATVSAGNIFYTNGATNQPVVFGSSDGNSAAGTRTLTIAFTYCILDVS